MTETRKKHDINNLIKIAKDNRDVIFKKEIDEDLGEAVKFCLSFNIKEGGNTVMKDIIYKAYKLYSISPVGKIEFFEEFSTLIPGEQKHYMLNYKPAQLLNAAQKRRVKINE